MRQHTDQAQSHYTRLVADVRQRKNRFFQSSPDSPILEDERGRRFPGLHYYPPDVANLVRALVVPFPQQEVMTLGTTTGEPRAMRRYAELRFRLGTEDLRLTTFTDTHDHTGHHHSVELFIPFRDATSGSETYGAGRYLDAGLERVANGAQTVVLDFNLAYNPYCAYNDAYCCPLPPAENRLPIAIRAGERAYSSHP
jgi:uncharacterized protein